MNKFGRQCKYKGYATRKEICVDPFVKYRVRMDGVMLYEESSTAQEAMDVAALYFKKDPSFQRAEIIKYKASSVGIVMKNNTKMSKV